MFCSERCKDIWHNIRKSAIKKIRASVIDTLNNNHEILEGLLKSGRTIWITPLLEAMGFKWDYFTRLVKIGHGSIVCECFDIRYRVSKMKLFQIVRIDDYPGDLSGKQAQISSASKS